MKNDITNYDQLEWIRVEQATKRYSVSKAKWYDLINSGRIKSLCLKERGQIRGTRLLSVSSIEALFERLAKGGGRES